MLAILWLWIPGSPPATRNDAKMANDSRFPAHGTAAELEEGTALTPKFDADGLVTCVATDAASGDVLMVAHMNAQALARTIATGEAWYFSRSRRALWKKGETSGHTQRVLEMRVDCDQDAVVIRSNRAAAPVTPDAAHISIARYHSARPARLRSSFARIAFSIRRRFTRTPKTRCGGKGCGRQKRDQYARHLEMVRTAT